jgi:hypothetical protein
MRARRDFDRLTPAKHVQGGAAERAGAIGSRHPGERTGSDGSDGAARSSLPKSSRISLGVNPQTLVGLRTGVDTPPTTEGHFLRLDTVCVARRGGARRGEILLWEGCLEANRFLVWRDICTQKTPAIICNPPGAHEPS